MSDDIHRITKPINHEYELSEQELTENMEELRDTVGQLLNAQRQFENEKLQWKDTANAYKKSIQELEDKLAVIDERIKTRKAKVILDAIHEFNFKDKTISVKSKGLTLKKVPMTRDDAQNIPMFDEDEGASLAVDDVDQVVVRRLNESHPRD